MDIAYRKTTELSFFSDAKAKEMLSNGYKLLDIRFDFEPEFYGYLPDGLHIPLHELKSRLTELDPDGKYIVYCKSGNRSQVGTLFLEQCNIKAVSLKGGFMAWPYNKVQA
jgi:rhodanese-related sulfurtransferase